MREYGRYGMQPFSFDAVVYDGEIYCTQCTPDEASEDDVSPIFADQSWDYAPVCCVCGEEHTYMDIEQPKEEEEANAEPA